MSADPAMEDYFPRATSDLKEEDKPSEELLGQRVQKTHLSATDLPQDGIYMNNNLQVYHYANNNPVLYQDPTGE